MTLILQTVISVILLILFTKRKNSHKSKCNVETNAKFHLRVYSFIRECGGWENWTMIPIEKTVCESVFDALRRERELIEAHNCTLNFSIPSRTKKEYHQTFLREKQKEYTAKRQEANAQYQKQYREENIATIQQKKHEYYEKNKETILDKNRANSHKYLEQKRVHGSQIVHCDRCGCEVQRDSVKRHHSSIKCQSFKSQ